MQKNEFEKQVRRKMEELRLMPSDAVWENIEARISSPRGRRRRGIFFLLLFACLFCGGGLLWYGLIYTGGALHKRPFHPVAYKTAADNKQTLPAPVAIKETGPAKHPADIPTKSVNAGRQYTLISRPYAKNGRSSGNLTKAGSPMKTSRVPDEGIPQKDRLKDGVSNDAVVVAHQYLHEIPAITQNQEPGNSAAEAQLGITIPEHKARSASAVITDTLVVSDPAKESNAKNPAPSPKHALTRNPWRLGFTLSAGISGIPNGFLGSLDKTYSPADALYSSTSPQSNPSTPQGTPPVLPSKIKSSEAFIAGLLFEKDLSKNTMITLGLQYKLFSSTSRTGERSSGSASFSLANAINNYQNYFHFIELPVAIKVRVGLGKADLFWDGGVSLSRLIGSNALQFNSGAVVYYRDNSLFNKTQAGFNTGVSISVFPNPKATVLTGPYMFYGTSKIAAKNLYRNQHFTFIGLRAQVLLKKL